MASPHRNLAVVWEQLLNRNDISATLREIIGQHALQNALQEDKARNTNESIETIIWIKTIYDLQRCYLSGTTAGGGECPPQVSSSLLPSELLFSSILYLINAKLSIFPSETTLMTKEFTRPRQILAQTVLSGLRLLLLNKDYLSSNQRRRLQAALNAAWKDDHLQGAERCIVQQVFAAILDVLDADHVDAYAAERAHARLPTYIDGLYPIDIRPETSITPLIHAMAEEDDDWVDAYLVLFDALWAVECAVTQRYIDLRREHGVVLDLSVIENDEIFEQLYHQRSSLIVSIFHVKSPMVPSDTLMESLAVTLLDWDESLDSFLTRQDSLLQHHMSLPQAPSRVPNYGKHIAQLRPYFETATLNFAAWLSKCRSNEVSIHSASASQTGEQTQETIKRWVERMASPHASYHSQQLEGSDTPVYVVDCPKLHVVPRKYLAYQLRWNDKWAYESIQEDSPIINWKEGVKCPSCAAEEKIKCARLLEPLHQPSIALANTRQDVYSQSQYSGDGSGSYVATLASTASRSISDGASAIASLPGQSTMNVSIPTTVSHPSSDPWRIKSPEVYPPQYMESPTSPMTLDPLLQRSRSSGSSNLEYPVSPFTESLNIPVPMLVGSRLSVDLPIPVHTPSSSDDIPEDGPLSAVSDLSSTRKDASLNSLTWVEPSMIKSKSKSTTRSERFTNSMRRRPTTKEKSVAALPKDPRFAFSSSGRSLFLWGKGADDIVRLDLFDNEMSAFTGCRYGTAGVEAVAGGNHKCAIVAAHNTSKKKLLVFDGISLIPETIELDIYGRLADVCIAVSRDDKHVALSVNDQIELFKVESGLKRIAFHHQVDVYELRGGLSRQQSIPVTRTTRDETVTEHEKAESGSWFSAQSKTLSMREVAEEQQRQTAIISRKLYFSTDSQRLVVATQLGDHSVHVDVWDVTREPVSTISEHSRSFKLPPWVLNDGDLTSIFYDSNRRAALVTAFLGKEYPVLIPFPGYDPLQNETYSTKIVSAAQSPSGSTFIIANAMTEIIQFEYTAKGTLSPHKLKKSSSKISNSVFKPGAIALAMPSEDVLQAFWIRDGKCMLRTVKLGATEIIKDMDITPHHNRLMSLKDRPVIARAPSVGIPELDAGDFI